MNYDWIIFYRVKGVDYSAVTCTRVSKLKSLLKTACFSTWYIVNKIWWISKIVQWIFNECAMFWCCVTIKLTIKKIKWKINYRDNWKKIEIKFVSYEKNLEVSMKKKVIKLLSSKQVPVADDDGPIRSIRNDGTMRGSALSWDTLYRLVARVSIIVRYAAAIVFETHSSRGSPSP